ncbi:acylphosphatase [Verrucomicrobiota bacterium]|jgi:acylphosphatase|nr:acylphosphatase [Verrucomicrobiota bacterium]
MTGRHVFFEGRVQGVGFRWTVKNLARGYDVTGWVKNLPDGRVEMQASGDGDEVDAFIEAIEESELKSHIKKVDVSVMAPPAKFRGFEILQ